LAEPFSRSASGDDALDSSRAPDTEEPGDFVSLLGGWQGGFTSDTYYDIIEITLRRTPSAGQRREMTPSIRPAYTHCNIIKIGLANEPRNQPGDDGPRRDREAC